MKQILILEKDDTISQEFAMSTASLQVQDIYVIKVEDGYWVADETIYYEGPFKTYSEAQLVLQEMMFG